MPQLREQKENALKELEFALARSGMTNSSLRAQKMAELQRTFDESAQTIRSGALDFRNTAAGNIEAQRKALIDGLTGTANASRATAAARRAAAGVQMPNMGGPLANMFAGFSDGLQGMQKRDIYSEFM